jgi:hypothetical protein
MTDVYLFSFYVMIGYTATEIPLVHSSKHIFSFFVLIQYLNPLSRMFFLFGCFYTRSMVINVDPLTTSVARVRCHHFRAAQRGW